MNGLVGLSANLGEVAAGVDCGELFAELGQPLAAVTIFAATLGTIAFDRRATTTNPPRIVPHSTEPASLNDKTDCRMLPELA